MFRVSGVGFRVSIKSSIASHLTPEKKLAWAQQFLAQHFSGSQQIRQLAGHTQFGARVQYGDCLFFTISPNEQHSALVLLLSRFRLNDPYTRNSTPVVQRLASSTYPRLEAKRRKTTAAKQASASQQKDDYVEIELPEYAGSVLQIGPT